jgi:hypothetical protein
MAYFPNGSAGEVLDNQCADFPLGEKTCPVALAQALFNYSQFTNGKPNTVAEVLEVLVNKDSICQLRPLLVNPQDDPLTLPDPTKVMPCMREWLEKRIGKEPR